MSKQVFTTNVDSVPAKHLTPAQALKEYGRGPEWHKRLRAECADAGWIDFKRHFAYKGSDKELAKARELDGTDWKPTGALRVLLDLAGRADSPATVLGARRNEEFKRVEYVLGFGTVKVLVNAAYHLTALNRFPQAVPFVVDDVSPVVYRVPSGEVVALVMPLMQSVVDLIVIE